LWTKDAITRVRLNGADYLLLSSMAISKAILIRTTQEVSERVARHYS
jgi:hypothetical protein